MTGTIVATSPRRALALRLGLWSFAIGLGLIGILPGLFAVWLGIEGGGLILAGHLVAVPLVAWWLAAHDDRVTIAALVLILPWQPVLSMLVSNAVGPTGIRIMVATKELFVLTLVGVYTLRNIRRIHLGLADKAAAVFVLVNLIYAVHSTADPIGRVASLREPMMFVSFYLLGRLLLWRLADVRWFLQCVVLVSCTVATFGFAERFVFSDHTWHSLGAVSYVEGKRRSGAVGTSLGGEVPNQWFTWISGSPVRRMVASVGDPTSLSRFLALPILALIAIPGIVRRSPRGEILRWCGALLLVGASALSLGRGGQVIVLIGIVTLLFAKNLKIGLLVGVPSLALLLTRIALFDIRSGSAVRHLGAFFAGLQALLHSPWGHGIGTAGQQAQFFSTTFVQDISESYFAAVAYQTGVLGVVAFAAFGATIVVTLLRFARQQRASRGFDDPLARSSIVGLGMAVGVFSTAVLGNSAVAPISAGLTLLFCGALVGLAGESRAGFGHDASFPDSAQATITSPQRAGSHG